MEHVSLQCELLVTRIKLIASQIQCPDDLVESCATLVYCSQRLEIKELEDITTQLALKYGEEWARAQLNNSMNQVSPKVLFVFWLYFFFFVTQEFPYDREDAYTDPI